MLTLKGPIDRGEGKLVLEFGATRLEVTPAHGGRITSLRYADTELLTQTGAPNFEDAFGSTFWPSPQRWPWPPPAELDTEPYAVTVDERGSITLVSRPSAVTQLQLTKKVSADLRREAIELTYEMTNTAAEAVSWAPWEITRMPPDGLAFWRTDGEPFGEAPLFTQAAHGHTWCEPRRMAGERKTFADGGGYLAYAVGAHVLVKHFPDIPAGMVAPGEAEVEVYVNELHSYVEIENQGAYASIAPGATTAWKVLWYVRQLPPGLGSAPHADLVAFVTQTLQ
jgi:Domain of unknown function (DUF4380)